MGAGRGRRGYRAWLGRSSKAEASAAWTAMHVGEQSAGSSPCHPCAGDSKLYLWTPEGASCVHIPLPGFRAAGLAWHPGGESLVLTARDAFCCAFFG